MADETPPLVLDRIDRAITRIESAVAERTRVSDAALADRQHAVDAAVARHATLRTRMEEALTAIDAVIAQGERGEPG